MPIYKKQKEEIEIMKTFGISKDDFNILKLLKVKPHKAANIANTLKMSRQAVAYRLKLLLSRNFIAKENFWYELADLGAGVFSLNKRSDLIATRDARENTERYLGIKDCKAVLSELLKKSKENIVYTIENSNYKKISKLEKARVSRFDSSLEKVFAESNKNLKAVGNEDLFSLFKENADKYSKKERRKYTYRELPDELISLKAEQSITIMLIDTKVLIIDFIREEISVIDNLHFANLIKKFINISFAFGNYVDFNKLMKLDK